MTRICLFVFTLLLSQLSTAGAHVHLQKASVDLHDKAALQRGAKMYMNYCSGCHSLKYMRYNRMANDLGLIDHTGALDRELLVNNLIFTQAKPFDPITIAMPQTSAREWFGVVPPDLSLIGREKGADYLYTYLSGFYQDDSRPYGANNIVKPGVSMPNVLLNLQGRQVPHYVTKIVPYNGHTKEVKEISYLQVVDSGTMDTSQFQSAVNDLVTFLMYVGEPIKTTRQFLGWWVLGYLSIFLIIAYLLKKNFWADLKNKKR